MPQSAYSKAARKTKAAMRKQYGKRGDSVFYALANKRTGGLKGKNRGSRAANTAFAKGSHWKSGRKTSSGRKRTGGRRRLRG